MSESFSPELVALVSDLRVEPSLKSQLLAVLSSLPDVTSPPNATTAEIIQLQQDAAGDIVKGTSRRIGNVRFHLRDFILSAAKTGTGAITGQGEVISSVIAALAFLNDVIKHATINLSTEDARILYTIWTMLENDTVPTIPALAAALDHDISELKLAARIQHLIELGCVKMAAGDIGLNDRIVIRSELI